MTPSSTSKTRTFGLKVWTGGIWNSPTSSGGTFTLTNPIPDGLQSNGWGWDGGLRANVWGFEFVGYYYYAEGIGTTAIGSSAVSYVCPAGAGLCPGGVGASLDKRKSDGGYGQLSYKFQDVKIGYSWGQSHLKAASNESATFVTSNPNLVRYNTSNVVGVYYALTKSLNLVGEWVNTESKAQNGSRYNDNAYILGAILFF